MAWTQTQLDALDQAIAEGVTVVRYEDKTVEYRSLKEMMQIRQLMREELGVVGDAAGGRLYARFSKGLSDDSDGGSFDVNE